MRGVVLSGAYVILWWLALFVLLPVGLHNEDDPPGEFVPGAEQKPASPKHRPRLLLKAVGATLIAGVLWAMFYALVVYGVIQF